MMTSEHDLRGQSIRDIVNTFYRAPKTFDQWLAEHDREIAERAWDEGYGTDEECEVPRDNPYRGGSMTERQIQYEGGEWSRTVEKTVDEADEDYREIFGRDPEPWREPLGALRLTLAGSDVDIRRARAEGEELLKVLNGVGNNDEQATVGDFSSER